MSRILRRPMFKMGGSTNSGIMTGLVDRKGYADDTGIKSRVVAKSARDYISEFNPLLQEFTPKTQLPLGAVGAALVSGTPMKDALISGYTDFTKRDDARTAGIQKGGVQLGLSQAIKDMTPGKMSQIALKAKEAFGKKVINPTTGKPFASYNEAYTFYSMSASDPGRRSIPGDVEKSKQNFIALGTYGDNEEYAERHAIANTIVKKAVPQDENYTGRKIKIKDGKYKTQGEIPGIYVDIKGNKIIEINPDGTTEERPELTAILKSYR